MLEYTGAGDGARLAMLVLHDDATREYAYGPAQWLPDTMDRILHTSDPASGFDFAYPILEQSLPLPRTDNS